MRQVVSLILLALLWSPAGALATTIDIGDKQEFALPEGGSHVLPSPDGSRVAVCRGLNWYVLSMEDNGLWSNPVAAATGYTALDFVGWDEGDDSSVLLLSESRYDSIPAATRQGLARVASATEQEHCALVELGDLRFRSPVAGTDAVRLLCSELTKKPALADKIETGPDDDSVKVVLNSVNGDKWFRLTRWGGLFDASQDGTKFLCRPADWTSLTYVDLVKGTTTAFAISGYSQPSPGRSTGKLSPDGNQVAVNFVYGSDDDTADQYYHRLQVFTVTGEYLADVDAFGDIYEGSISTDVEWLTTGWLVYTTGNSIVFRQVTME